MWTLAATRVLAHNHDVRWKPHPKATCWPALALEPLPALRYIHNKGHQGIFVNYTIGRESPMFKLEKVVFQSRLRRVYVGWREGSIPLQTRFVLIFSLCTWHFASDEWMCTKICVSIHSKGNQVIGPFALKWLEITVCQHIHEFSTVQVSSNIISYYIYIFII